MIHAKKEIVVSAGAIGTPHLLMLSGIGDKRALAAAGVAPLVHLPSVGQNMTDHVLLGMAYAVNSSATFDDVFRSADVQRRYRDEWAAKRTGPLSASIANHLGWFRLPADSGVLSKLGDPAVGPASAHWELIILVRAIAPARRASLTCRGRTSSLARRRRRATT